MIKRPHKCWPLCPLHDWNEVKFDLAAYRKYRPFVLCDGCRKCVRQPNRLDLPEGWVTKYTPSPWKHYCPDCKDKT